MSDGEYFRKVFDYVDGELYWKQKVSPKVVVGNLAGDICNGRRRIRLNKKSLLAHRIIFMMHYNYLPSLVDHIDGDITNNRIENLREATYSQNQQNRKLGKDNTSGYKNVQWKKQKQKWMVEVKKDKNRIFVGYFDDLELASFAAEEARIIYHKEFSRHV